MQDALLTVREVADRLKVSTATIYKLCASGELTFTRISTHAIRLSPVDVAEFVGRRGLTVSPHR